MPDFSKLFHQSSKDLQGGGSVRIPRDESLWPEEWKTIYYKTYPRFEKIALPVTTPTADFFDLIRGRRTDRRFAKNALTSEKLSTLIKYSCGITAEHEEWNPRRAQPSGGARYPLEVYPILFSPAGDIPAGMYHYDVKAHALDVLAQRSFASNDIAPLSSYEWVQNASCLLVITAVFWRTQRKYGERGYRYAMLEAGHIGQNVYLASMALDLKCSGLGGTLDENIEKLLDIDGINESVVYGLVIG